MSEIEQAREQLRLELGAAMLENNELVKVIERQRADIAELREALYRLVFAFDIGHMIHTSFDGRGYAAIDEARALLRG